jgi:nucleotide-binding universal stress UspA family protein
MEFNLPRPGGRIVTDDVHLTQRRSPLVIGICAASPAGLNAARRAALVATQLGADLNILYPAPQARAVSRGGDRVRELADDIRQRTGIKVAVETVKGSVLRHAVALSRDAAVVVLPSCRGNPLREWIMGTQAERLIRLCRAPVLVVKRPALLAYRRVLVPLDLDHHAVRLIGLAASLSRGLRLKVLHAIDADDEKALRAIDGSDEAVCSLRQHRAHRAYLALHRLIAAAQIGAAGAEASIEFGGAAAVVLDRAAAWDAELVVIGKAQRGMLADYFLGGLTQRILARARADVLVHPHRRQRANVPRLAMDQRSCMP